MVVIKFDRGSLLIYGDVSTPYGRWDPRIKAFRAMSIYYRDILEYLEDNSIFYRDEAANSPPISTLRSSVKLRPYQKTALHAWFQGKLRGVVVLPTAAGKTFVALKAIEKLNVSTLVVVPTLELMDQWKQLLTQKFNVKIGSFGGGDELLEPLTVITYDSAYLRAGQLGNKFLFLVFDEVHHLPAPSYSQIAEMYIAPYRIGLTATYEREDGRHIDLPRLVGGRVYELGVDSLAGSHLSPYTYEKVLVSLTPEEQKLYMREYKIFKDFLKSRRIALKTAEDFRRFIMRTGWDSDARGALLARNKALKVAFNSDAKIDVLSELLNVYRREKKLIFTRYNKLVYRISRRFLIPAVTYQTRREERKDILQKFKAGEYEAVVTSQVLDEGVDVPDASVGFILSGSGSSREYIQRLGRILRKREGKKAKLIEIVARETVETKLSQRRHKRRERHVAK